MYTCGTHNVPTIKKGDLFMDMNNTCISGRVAFMNKLEYRNNKPFLRIGVSVRTGNRKGADGKYPSMLYPCHIWGPDAENIANYIFVGQVVSVNGSMATYEAMAKGSNKKSTSWFLNVERGGFHMHTFKEVKQQAPVQQANTNYQQQPSNDPYSQFGRNIPREEPKPQADNFDPLDPDNLPF